MSGSGPVVLAALVALLTGAATWLLVPAPASAERPAGPARPRGPLQAVRERLERLRPGSPAEPPGVRVARAAAEVAALLRAGAVPAAAWAPQRADAVGPPGRHLDAVDAALDAAARAAAAGEDPAAALREHRGAVPAAASGSALGSLALAWRTSESTGAPAAVVLERLAAALRDEAAATDARDAALAGPRATARLLLALPPLGLAASTALGADPLAVLVGTPAGRWCAALGATSAVAGWAWSAALVRAATRAR